MMTDPVYEGKSMQGMMDIIRRGEIPAGSKILYAHLGGVPAINAYSFLYRNGCGWLRGHGLARRGSALNDAGVRGTVRRP
ncbi:hypothetical protein G6F24_018917 [Rhizopus arrhizus]|nr:hypothetical protein G6F24_018917 [Rhizopus arrhizus]